MIKFILMAAISFSVSLANAQRSEIFLVDGVAINGYDVTEFFTQSRVVRGKKRFQYEWNGAKWNFVSEKNMIAFQRSPEKFAPQYGGYCAYGTAEGHKAPIRPDTWTVIDGKLYFNYNQSVKKIWEKDREHFIAEADKNWPTVKIQE